MKKSIDVYRGLHPKHIENAVCAWKRGNIGEIHEWAFGSFTTKKTKAAEYAIDSFNECPTMLHLVLEPGDKALYINKIEEEWLLPPEQSFQIMKCDKIIVADKKGREYEGKIYTIVKLT